MKGNSSPYTVEGTEEGGCFQLHLTTPYLFANEFHWVDPASPLHLLKAILGRKVGWLGQLLVSSPQQASLQLLQTVKERI